MMARGNPNPSPATRFQPGNPGNPGGKTSAQRKLEIANAEKATRIRAHLLDQMMTLVEAGLPLDLETNLLNLVKSSEDRGLGAPKQEQEVNGSVQWTFETIYERKPD
jgi:hypothetical protein